MTARDVLGAVAGRTRRQMLDRLAVSELPVSELAESFEMSLPAVSQHLKVLREAGLVEERREARQHINQTVTSDFTIVIHPSERIWRALTNSAAIPDEVNQPRVMLLDRVSDPRPPSAPPAPGPTMVVFTGSIAGSRPARTPILPNRIAAYRLKLPLRTSLPKRIAI